jgi:hypothetical protein
MDIFEINITSEETLLRAFDVLHDATCDEDDIKYDSEKGILDIIFDREFLEDSSKISVRRVLFIFHKFEFPIVKSHLHLEGLNFCKMHSKDKSLKTHMFNECRIKQNKYILYFCEVLEMEIGFKSSITGYLKDIKFVEGKKGSFVQFRKKLNLPPSDNTV